MTLWKCTCGLWSSYSCLGAFSLVFHSLHSSLASSRKDDRPRVCHPVPLLRAVLWPLSWGRTLKGTSVIGTGMMWYMEISGGSLVRTISGCIRWNVATQADTLPFLWGRCAQVLSPAWNRLSHTAAAPSTDLFSTDVSSLCPFLTFG